MVSTWGLSPRNHILMSRKTVCHTSISQGSLSIGCSMTMTMMCGGMGLTWWARRSITAELYLDKPHPRSPVQRHTLGQCCSAWRGRLTQERWRRTGGGLRRWLLAVFTFFVCRTRTSTAVIHHSSRGGEEPPLQCARLNDARQGVPVGHLLLRAWCGRSGRSSGELIGAREGTGSGT